jgi:UDP-N-acetyl-D-glucosamine dehydrogenase
VAFHDPFVASIREDGHVRQGVDLTTDAVAGADAVVIVTDHRRIDYQMLMDHADLIIDTRNAMSSAVKTKARVVGLTSMEASPAALTPSSH